MLFPSKKVLSHQISNAIKKKWSKECTVILDEIINNDDVNSLDNLTEAYPIQNSNSVLLSRLKERIEALEELNDHLCCYLSFLIENLPELITKTMESGADFNLSNEKSIRRFHINNCTNPNEVYPLPTRREHDVLELLEKGFCAKEIATRLYISETTVITHKKNLKKKFNVKNTAELISKIRSGT